MTAIVVRSFTGSPPTPAQRYMQVLELPAVPVAGHRVTVPGSGPLVVRRVILHARHGWSLGIAPAPIEVELEPEAEADRTGALECGWIIVEDPASAPPRVSPTTIWG